MKRLILLLIPAIFCLPGTSIHAQTRDFNMPDRPDAAFSAQLKDIRAFENGAGFAYSADSIFATNDGGSSWQKIGLPRSLNDRIAGASFADTSNIWVVVADPGTAQMRVIKSSDSGGSWTALPIVLRERDLQEADLGKVTLLNEDGQVKLTVRLASSSNFVREAVYTSADEGQTWSFESDEMRPASADDATHETLSGISADESVVKDLRAGNARWVLTSSGNCEGFKSGCVQTSKIYTSAGSELRDITPPEIKTLAETLRHSSGETATRMFQAPGGSTRISLNRGFDKCTAANTTQMQAWWNNSPFYDVNIYMSGRNRGCTQAQLTASWIEQVSGQGWGFIPTIVGYQSPCSVCTSCQKHSSDPAMAETQGRGEADIAITDATNLGLLAGTVLYYDMERYDDVSGTGACSTPTKAFLKGWTDRLKELGYVSGVYGSPFNAQGDWINIPAASQMDAVWLARWNNVMSVWGVAPLPDSYWTNHQRIHQWLGPRDETWGGVTFNIDNNILDAPVAGAAIRKNQNADFDGDGKTDVSVYRPDTGYWYVLNSSNGSFTGAPFGNSTDIIAPGDYDGDGKTDYAVFRAADGDWFIQTKAGLSAKHFGAAGDIPIPADYNGDGKTDIAVFRPSDGVWYIANSDSLGTYNFQAFGQTGDKPVPADYDGDGKTDIAVYRPSAGDWYVLRSSDGQFAGTHFGIATDKPVPGDHDGDGKADPAVFRDGTWYVLRSTAGFYGVQFGMTGDSPLSGDYDGDGKSDSAVFRAGDPAWYMLQSQNGYTAANFGLATDKPVPGAYLPQ